MLRCFVGAVLFAPTLAFFVLLILALLLRAFLAVSIVSFFLLGFLRAILEDRRDHGFEFWGLNTDTLCTTFKLE
jgi:hypothetical protein